MALNCNSLSKDTTRSIVVIWINIFQTEKTIEIQLVGQLTYKARKMDKSLFQHNCCCPMLLKWTTNTAVCFQAKAIFHHLYGF